MRLCAPVFLALVASACSNAPVRIESRALADQISRSPEHFIIAAVDNDPSVFVARAGSTPRGYDAVAPYGPSPAARQTMRALENDYGLREVSAWPIDPLHMHCAVLEVPDGTDRSTVLAAMVRDRRIRLAEPLQSFATRTQPYNDPYVGLQRGFQQMDVAEAHPWSRGEGIKVAIIDTGADTEHPDLRGNIAAAANFVDSDDRQFRLDRHGTEIAGVIGAVANNGEGIVGIAPGARLLLFKACWQARSDADAARCNSFTLARALVAAFDAHAQIINLSLAGPADPLLTDLIREGLRRGVLFIGAAADMSVGNEGLLHQPGVIEVTSAGKQSAVGSALYAPGREILTLLPGGHYDFASGDSMATAEISGVVALLLAKKSGLSAEDAYRLLRDTSAHPGGDAGGGLLVDACAAMVSLVGHGYCNPTTDNGPRMADELEQRVARH
jgi:subtilisin family serine protease